MTSRQKVAVVGGGAMGSAAAWRLALRGYDVMLFEQFEPGHVRGASHGSSRIFRHAFPDRRYVAFAARADALWHELETADGTTVLEYTGAVDHGDPDSIDQRAAALRALGLQHQILTPDEAQQRWSGMRFDRAVLHHTKAGRLNADLAVGTLQRQAAAQGAQIRHRTPVRAITLQGNGVEIVTDSSTERFDHVVVAAGAWSVTLLDGLVDLPPLRTTQEQPVHFRPVDPSATWPSFIHRSERAGEIYGLGSIDGIKLGEHGTGPQIDPDHRDFRADPAGVERLREYARQWLPGVDADSAEPVTCLYTSTPDDNFVIDRSGPITVAAGFSGHGFKFTPAVGDLVADLVQGTSNTLDLFSFRKS